MFAGSIALLALAFSQAPGFLSFDTKFDLVVDPWHYMQRGLHLWDSNGAIGQLQNQAYGYLWPMGPFFGVGQAAGLPEWAVQRLFMALVLVVGFTGVAYVARALGVRSHLGCLLAGFAYAMSPRMLTTVGTISIESWPGALAPWVLLPLVVGATRGSPRRAAALSALAVAMIGGVNATASFAAIPVAAIWLLTRSRGVRKRRLMLWWPVFTALGTLWWLAPLFLLGTYSPPFLDFIESASLTTTPTTLFDSLRGTSHWLPYLDTRWRAGNDLVTDGYLVLNSGMVLMLGLLGLMHRRNPHRLFLVLTLAVGLLMVGMGHLGEVQGWFAPQLHSALDGVLAAARNVHKFDPVIRLPLVLGIALLLDALASQRSTSPAVAVPPGGRAAGVPARAAAGDSPAAYRSVAGLTVVAIIGGALPGILGRMAPSDLVAEVPGYWIEAGAWLDARDEEGAALMSPGIGVAQFVWGSTNDEPLEFLVEEGRFGVRSNIPFVPPGNIRALDAIEERLTQGRPSRGLAPFLARAGVEYLVVRNDVIKAPDIPDTVLLHQALDGSPGLRRTKGFGPNLGSPAHFEEDGDRNVINGGWQTDYQAIEIYEVVDGGPGAVAADELPLVVGGPESLLDLADAGVLDEQPTVLASDADPEVAPDGPLVLTDGYRDRERFFGQLHDGYSATTLPDEPRHSDHPTKDFYLNADDDRWRTRSELVGARSLVASSSMGDANGAGGARPAESAYAAIDGDESTQWASNPTAAERPTWTLTLEEPRPVTSVRLVGGVSAASFQTVRVVTDNGATDPVDLGPAESAIVEVPEGPTSWIRVETVGQADDVPAAIAEVEVPGVSVDKLLRMPSTPAVWGTPDVILMTAARDGRSGCVEVDGDVRCLPGRDVGGEEDTGFSRALELSGSAVYEPEVWVRPRPGSAVEEALLEDLPVSVTSSSQAVPDVRASALAALDGRPGTAWMASTGDFRPTLRTRWVGRAPVSGVSVSLDPDTAGRMPTRLLLTYRGGSREVDLDEQGRAEFPPVRTDFLDVEVLQTDFTSSVGFDQLVTPLAAAIGELRIEGAPFETLAPPQASRDLPCGSGPDVTINGQVFRTAVTTSSSRIFDGEEVQARLCGSGVVRLAAGDNRVDVESSDVFSATRLVLRDSAFAPGTSTPVRWSDHDADSRTAVAPDGSAVLAFRENGNRGWTADRDGVGLTPVRVDGWQQGWLLDEGGTGAVVETYAPETAYRWGLAIGLGTGLLLLALVLFWWRRPPGDDPPAVGAASIHPWTWSVGAFAVTGLLAGWAGVAVLVATWVAWRLLSARRLADVRDVALASMVVIASFFYLVRPWGQDWAGASAWPQLLSVVTLGGLFLAVGEPTLRRRITGTSTNR
ncbi:alpha-(1-_3)-arabinofuranosyltransferase family protein [Nocardioides sp. STR2]|uniref:Alpha-(1->3)-arabinofuranosyltransferase family protein n=1 Tax=Nocardioides pini TaxID=2975053 RepID=A0ABT4CCR8_9ACTN|nr:alpha-(1->3)-arabinofuranosyltransferase family protein [Nocardioides pini]MCY4726191.1 alpha-(1->3)-arabinofuranosyltransferase family protein [Nocardioides pini]